MQTQKFPKDFDDMSMYVISKVIVSIARPLAHIFNLSFSWGVFPDHMKIAKIIPIFKNGQKTEKKKYHCIVHTYVYIYTCNKADDHTQ